MHGGLAQGIAQAPYEEAVYDADGNLTTGTFVDYLVPSAADLPHFDTGNTVHPAPGNPIGAKGVGEADCIASTPAVVNAALDAVRHLGVSGHPDAADAGTRLAGDPPGWDGGDRADSGHHRLRRRLDRDDRGRLHRRFLAGRGPMIPAPFAYARPSTIDEALQAVASGGEDVKILAGGQSLIPSCGCGWPPRRPSSTSRGSPSCAGPGRRRRDRHRRDDDPLRRPLRSADRPVRAAHRGGHRDGGRPPGPAPRTFGGALAHADPAGDLPAVALALDAEFVIAGLNGRRTVPAAEFFVDYLTTALEEGSCSSRSACPSTRAGACTTRSSTASRRPGRSWRWPRRCASRADASPRRRSG